jgi:peptide/nickel transport system permease protein/oligopeptide transport system permease protein
MARRLLQFIPVVIGTMFLLHYITTLGIQFNGDPIRALFGDQRPPDSVLNAIRDRYNLDDPCLQQKGNPCLGIFVDRLGQYFQGDFGQSLKLGNRPVTALVVERAPVTLRLTTIAIVFETVVGITIGVLAALRKDKFVDNTVRVVTTLLISMPIFVFGVLVQVFVALPVGEKLAARGAPEWAQAMFSPVYDVNYPWVSLIVPGIVLGAVSLASIARLTRTSLIENLRADYVRTARAKGLAPRRTVGVHALRNSLIPVVTYIGIDIGSLMGGALITETIFSIPGIGQLVYLAVLGQDAVVIIGVTTLLVLVFLVANLLVDVLYAVLDPRIRYD